MKALEIFNAGHLDEAIDAGMQEVKRDPTNVGARITLGELLCFTPDLPRADKQLGTALQQAPAAALRISLLRQLIRAETSRRECFQQGRSPEFLGEPSPAFQLQLQALLALRQGEREAAAELVTEAEQCRPRVTGVCNGRAFADIRDLDDLCGPVLEVATSTGRYFWTPFEQLEIVEFEPPQHPSDLLWRQARVVVRGGPDGIVYIPTLYVDSAAAPDDSIRLGRATHWLHEDTPPVQGLGRRLFWIDEEEVDIMELRSLQFAANKDAPA